MLRLLGDMQASLARVVGQVRQADGSMRAETRTFWTSHVGPIVYRTADRAFAPKAAYSSCGVSSSSCAHWALAR